MTTFFKRRITDADIDDELRSHLTLAIQERIDRGQSPDEARRAAIAYGRQIVAADRAAPEK